jgi:hypothetical protein
MFIDIDQPLCAWFVYRGALVPAPNEPGFVSIWAAGLMELENPGRIAREEALETVRASQFPERVSRLRGMFCLPDLESARRACSWDQAGRTHFQLKYLAKLSVGGTRLKRDWLDSNWITHASVF